MNRLFSRSLLSGFIAAMTMVASSQSIYAENLNVLGNLEAKGQIQVLGEGVLAPIRLSNTTYTYVAGDIVKTGKGSGILSIPGVGRIGLAPDTEIMVTEADMGVDVELVSGAIGYSLTPGSNFTVNVAGMVVRPMRSPLQRVNTGSDEQVIGWIAVGEDGLVEVGSHSGTIEINRDGTLQVVQAGEQSVLQYQSGQLIATQLGGAGGGYLGGLSGLQILGIVVVAAAVGYVVYDVAFKDDDEPASP